MARRPKNPQAVVLLLVAALAWPWNVALLARQRTRFEMIAPVQEDGGFQPVGFRLLSGLQKLAENLLKRRGAGRRSYEDMQEAGFICFGSAETVRQRLTEYQKRLGFGKLVSMLQFGSLPADLTRQNMERFARDVMPHLRALDLSATPAVAAS